MVELRLNQYSTAGNIAPSSGAPVVFVRRGMSVAGEEPQRRKETGVQLAALRRLTESMHVEGDQLLHRRCSGLRASLMVSCIALRTSGCSVDARVITEAACRVLDRAGARPSDGRGLGVERTCRQERKPRVLSSRSTEALAATHRTRMFSGRAGHVQTRRAGARKSLRELPERPHCRLQQVLLQAQQRARMRSHKRSLFVHWTPWCGIGPVSYLEAHQMAPLSCLKPGAAQRTRPSAAVRTNIGCTLDILPTSWWSLISGLQHDKPGWPFYVLRAGASASPARYQVSGIVEMTLCIVVHAMPMLSTVDQTKPPI